MDGAILTPPRPLLAILFASLFGCVLTAGYSYRYTVKWERERAGRTIEEQRRSMGEIPVFKGNFVSVTKRIREILPPGTKVFLQPTRMAQVDNQRARWFLFLTYYLHPVQVFVRKPQFAAGTLVNYTQWNSYHRRYPRLFPFEAQALGELGIEWKLRMPGEWEFLSNEIYLERLIDGDWVAWDIWTNRPLVKRN